MKQLNFDHRGPDPLSIVQVVLWSIVAGLAVALGIFFFLRS
jgi:hypothetical protein